MTEAEELTVKKVIFSNRLYDSFMEPVSTLTIYNRDRDNVVYRQYKEDPAVNTLPAREIRRLIEAIKTHGILNVEEISNTDTGLADGNTTNNTFYFAAANHSIELSISNFYECIGNENNSPEVNILVETLIAIADILSQHGLEIEI